MTSLEDLEKRVDAILKRNDEADFENKILKEYNELVSEQHLHLIVAGLGIILFAAIYFACLSHSATVSDIKTHALAAQNITEYITNLKAV